MNKKEYQCSERVQVKPVCSGLRQIALPKQLCRLCAQGWRKSRTDLLQKAAKMILHKRDFKKGNLSQYWRNFLNVFFVQRSF